MKKSFKIHQDTPEEPQQVVNPEEQKVKVEKSSEEVVMLKKQVEELTNDLQRTRADFENYRKQIEAQKLQEKKIVKYATVMKVLPLIDDMSLAISKYQELEPLKKSLEKALKEFGLNRIPSELGVEFNPDLHEAVMVEGEGEKEVVEETLRPGYYYESEVLRPAMVKVKKTGETLQSSL